MTPRREPDPQFWRDEARPRIAGNGIRARSKRGAIGEQWWSKRFTGVLESLGMAGRLARGRNYARSGQVLGFEISSGYVTAQVQGSRPKPYRVRIQVLPLTTAQWQRVTDELAAQALFRAKLLAGEMPPEIEEIFAGCGTPLFPRLARDMQMSCSCPDWEVPCKHLAAVCYVLAEAFDTDPFGILAWRGRGRDELLAALRGSAPGRPGEPAVPPPVVDVADRSLAEHDPAAFWSPGLSAARLRALPPAGLAPPDLLLRSLAAPDVRIRGRDLGTLLSPGYALLPASAVGDDRAAGSDSAVSSDRASQSADPGRGS
ncbi:MAG: SWIM zinc finger family protein [Streptosporangiaceae bacterium]